MNDTRRVQNSQKHRDTMKLRLTSGLLCLTVLLASCGGGGSSYVPTTPASCALPKLQYANGDTSGTPLSRQKPTAISALTLLPDCNLAVVKTATLTVCIKDFAIDRLHADLRLSGVSVAEFPLSPSTDSGVKKCLADDNLSVHRITLNDPNMRGLNSFAGPWSVAVTDSNPLGSPEPIFVAWGLEIQGLR